MFIDPFIDPIDALIALWDRVRATAPDGFDPATVTLATADAAGQPSARMVLLRAIDADGCVFYTNYESRKARDLDANPRAALCGFWHWLKQQARIEGRVAPASAAESDAYFASRPRGSQIGAWASPQSTVIAGRDTIEARVREAERRFSGGPVPRPDFWGGYRLIPDRIEFWEERPDRLHDRIVFERTPAGWTRTRLAP